MMSTAEVALSTPKAAFMRQQSLASAWVTSASMLAADVIAISIVYWVAVLGRYLLGAGYELRFYLELFPVMGLFIFAFLSQGLYPGLLLHPAEEIRRVFYCVTSVALIIAGGTFLWRNAEVFSRSIFLITWLAAAPAVLLSRYFTRHLLAPHSWWGISAIVLGSGPMAERVLRALRNEKLGLRITGVFSDDTIGKWSSDLPPILGNLSAAKEIAKLKLARYAVVAMPFGSQAELGTAIQLYCHGFSQVLLMSGMPGLSSMGVSAREIGGEVAFEIPQPLFQYSAQLIKRFLDLGISLFLLVMLAPILGVISALIKVTSEGPVLYGHSRYGRAGRVFRAIKFRTMLENSDAVLATHFEKHPDQMACWLREHKLKQDPRVTSMGKYLRRFSLDELPQLWNVLVGEMSLVGPRPIVKAEIPKYGQGYQLYSRVLPGLTGIWQVSGRSNTSYEDRVSFDEYYVRNWSIWLDFYLLARTIKVLVSTDGAY